MSTFNVADIAYIHHNERDVEIPVLFSMLQEELHRTQSLLDVGAAYSWMTYAPKLRSMLGQDKVYTACDIADDPSTAAFTNHFQVGNVNDLTIEKHDVVVCISAIEHAGISSYKLDNWKVERLRTMRRLCSLTSNRLLVTFPYGLAGIYQNEYANVTEMELSDLHDFAGRYQLTDHTSRFFYNEFPQGRYQWIEIGRDRAAAVPMDKVKGVQCVCIFDARRPL